MYSDTESFIHYVLVLAMLVFRVSFAMTRNGDPCFDNCIKYGSHYSCYKAVVSTSFGDVRSGTFSY